MSQGVFICFIYIAITLVEFDYPLPQRELVLMCLFETTIISPSYTSPHGIHHILTKDTSLHTHSYIRYIASPGKDKYMKLMKPNESKSAKDTLCRK